MNLNKLEKLARQVMKSDAAPRNGIVNPAEHKDLSSLSMQIAANMRAGATAANPPIPQQVYGSWL